MKWTSRWTTGAKRPDQRHLLLIGARSSKEPPTSDRRVMVVMLVTMLLGLATFGIARLFGPAGAGTLGGAEMSARGTAPVSVPSPAR
ncbi:MAG TPA: hypothetical protein VHK47_24310 [Polyangia bacterium]|jgi:hypothetical protein|nr:hypothetical protein [Polyangia bacterium]